MLRDLVPAHPRARHPRVDLEMPVTSGARPRLDHRRVTERRREIGIRIALGAARSDVLTQILKQGLQVTALGITIGLAGALAVNRLIASLLFGVQPTDTVTIAFVIATITAVAVVASWLPAWRASRLDPNVVLRDE